MRFLILFCFLFLFTSCMHNNKIKNSQGYDKYLSDFDYPYAVNTLSLQAQNQNVDMAFMDIGNTSSKKTIVLLHGKNFSGFYFESMIKDLETQGYRIIVPDQIGFGKSSKPENFQFTFHQLAELTHSLLKTLKIDKVFLVGHSMGGMLATRFTLMYPELVTKLILINPIGLEDYKTLTPYKNLNFLYQKELATTADDIRNYQKQFYYDGKWTSDYEKLIQPAVGLLQGPDRVVLSKNAAQTSEMIYTQPVFYEFEKLKIPTVLINGDRDKTAPGKSWAKSEIQKIMGDYPKLGRRVAKMIPRGKLVELKGLGHVPFIEDYNTFKNVFFKELDR